jgi:hypothetical protein
LARIAGHPLIAYASAAAQGSGVFDGAVAGAEADRQVAFRRFSELLREVRPERAA